MTLHWPRTLRWIILQYGILTSHKGTHITTLKMISSPISTVPTLSSIIKGAKVPLVKVFTLSKIKHLYL